jgi:phosphoribosylglycinamide formyltransferase-1
MKKLVILTGCELRHTFFRKYLAQSNGLNVVKSFCEIEKNGREDLIKGNDENSLRRKHLLMREQSEKDFFALYVESVSDRSNPHFISKGEINHPSYVREIIDVKPDLVIAYGCAIIQPPLIEAFEGRFVNVHLGLSPYYRGAGTNFWPFVNSEPEYAGVSFLHIDSGIDTGSIIHQLQATINYGDNIHQVGNRLIKDMAKCCVDLVNCFDNLEPLNVITPNASPARVYRKKDFTEASVSIMYQNFSNGLVDEYLAEKKGGRKDITLVQNPVLTKQVISL